MANKFFENEMEMGMCMTPNDEYRGIQQAFIDEQWENTTQEVEVEEQDYIGADTYHKVHVWVSKVIGTTTTFAKNGNDYRSLMYKELDYCPERGTYFKYENNYWISDFVNPADGVVGGNTIRRCTNFLRIVDPDNGSIFSIPCVLDYAMTSQMVQVSSYVITPNNHAIVIVQANPDTMRLFTYNKRFVIGGRAFKLTAFQNALMANVEEKEPTILYFDLSLDELHDGDDLVNQVANNGEYNYEITLDTGDITVPEYHVPIQVSATVTLNGEQVAKPVIWKSSNRSVVDVINGELRFYGKGRSTIEVSLKGNDAVYTEIIVVVADKKEIQPVVTMLNPFDKVRQYETKSTQFTVGGEAVHIIECTLDDGVLDNGAIKLTVEFDKILVYCYKPSVQTQAIYVRGMTDTYGEVEGLFYIRAVSLMG